MISIKRGDINIPLDLETEFYEAKPYYEEYVQPESLFSSIEKRHGVKLSQSEKDDIQFGIFLSCPCCGNIFLP